MQFFKLLLWLAKTVEGYSCFGISCGKKYDIGYLLGRTLSSTRTDASYFNKRTKYEHIGLLLQKQSQRTFVFWERDPQRRGLPSPLVEVWPWPWSQDLVQALTHPGGSLLPLCITRNCSHVTTFLYTCTLWAGLKLASGNGLSPLLKDDGP